MYINETAHITRQVFRDKKQLNILTCPTHERTESNLAKTGHNFYAMRGPGIKDWKEIYAPIPPNYTVYSLEKGDSQIPFNHEFDLVISQNKFGQYQLLSRVAYYLNIPMISVEHTLPFPGWPPEQLAMLRQMVGNANVFITEYSIGQWGFNDVPNTCVIPHCVNENDFNLGNKERLNHILTVANDYIGRDWCLNFSQYKRVCLDKKLPVRPVGDTKGLSEAAPSLDALVNEYQTSRIFLNTAHISPIPTSLLEAMGCGCACVSVNACAVPEYIKHGENGFLYNNDKEAAEYLNLLLHDKDLAEKIGKAAHKTILEKCNLQTYINNWNDLFWSLT